MAMKSFEREAERSRDPASQGSYASRADAYACLGLYRYGLGFSLDLVRTPLSRAAVAHQKVLELKGTEGSIPAYQANVWPDGLGELVKVQDETKPDYSLSNSVSTYKHVCIALCVGEFKLACDLAREIWDPPNAPYLGKKGRIGCTEEAVGLAYAVRGYFEGAKEEALRSLESLGDPRSDAMQVHQRTLWLALVSRNGDAFIRALEAYLSWHEIESTRTEMNRLDCERFICIPALGLASLAMEEGMVAEEALPKDNVFLPLSLIREA